ncbi:MAG: TetR/AcrR family transcriptional regulator [Myxococcales bacterium]
MPVTPMDEGHRENLPAEKSSGSKSRKTRGNNDERRRQILDAFLTCIGRNGLERTTVSDVADEAGLQRTLVYHYFKDREILIDSLIQHVDVTMLRSRFDAALGTEPELSVSLLLDTVFDNTFFIPTGEKADAFSELVSLGTRNDHVRVKIHEMWENFLEAFEGALVAATGARQKDCAVVAYAVTCIFEHNAVMQLLLFGDEYNRRARAACELLISNLMPLTDHRWR